MILTLQKFQVIYILYRMRENDATRSDLFVSQNKSFNKNIRSNNFLYNLSTFPDKYLKYQVKSYFYVIF